MFQGCHLPISLPYPKNGINLTNSDNSAKYIENMLAADNGRGKVRCGTILFTKLEPFIDGVTTIGKRIISGMSFLNLNGKSDILVYGTYITKIPNIEKSNITIYPTVGNPNKTVIQLIYNTSEQYYDAVSKIYDNSTINIVQESYTHVCTISNVYHNSNLIRFEVDLPKSDFDLDVNEEPNFDIWYERAVLGVVDDGLDEEQVIYDLDPNVIVSHVNFQNKLLICNGVDPVFVYDGIQLKELYAPKPILAKSDFVKTDSNIIQFDIDKSYNLEFELSVHLDSTLTLVEFDNTQEVSVLNIVKIDSPTDENNYQVTMTLNEDVELDIKNILYEAKLPKFSHLEVGHGRLWALGEGRCKLNEFKIPSEAQKVYYSAKQQSYNEWYNEKTGDIDFIDISINNSIPDNLEVIKFFEGYMLFIGRYRTQIWRGSNPVQNFDGEQNTQNENFVLDRVVEFGVLQKKLCLNINGELLLVSSLGNCHSLALNRYGIVETRANTLPQIKDYLEMQLTYIVDDNTYRSMFAFYYPYGDFVGIKIQNDVLIYQNKNNGHWSVFNGNFADAKSIFYNEIDLNLYLGMDDGNIISYADKLLNILYSDYDSKILGYKKISWRIIYDWMELGTTWHNTNIYISADSMVNQTINVLIYENNSLVEPVLGTIRINQNTAKFDVGLLNIASYAMKRKDFSHERIKFNIDTMMIEFNGFVENEFLFDKAILTGGYNIDKNKINDNKSAKN